MVGMNGTSSSIDHTFICTCVHPEIVFASPRWLTLLTAAFFLLWESSSTL